MQQGIAVGNDPSLDVCALTARQIADRVRSGGLSAVAVSEAFLARIEQWRDLDAVVLVDRETALGQASGVDRARAEGRQLGRLAGVPFLVKDNIEVAGQVCAAGTPGLKGNIAADTAPAVSALLADGAILLGRTNMHELALGITTVNAASGVARNPYDLNRSPGGSSGGAGAALAARLVPLALGSDTGASVRAPAAFCGVSALRPSVGDGLGERRYPLSGVVPLSPTRDTVGPMARTLADVALADAVIAGGGELPPVDLSRIRLGVPRRLLWENLDDEVARICEQALRRIEQAGVTLVESSIEALADLDPIVSLTVTLFEFAPSLRRYLGERGGRISYEHVASMIASSDVRALEALARTLQPSDYAHATDVALPALRRGYRDYFAVNGLDGYIIPTLPITAPSIDVAVSGRVEINGIKQPGGPGGLFATVVRNLDASSLAGIPSVAFPAGLTRAGLPVGLEVDGPIGSDRTLLAIGSAIEAVLGSLPAPVDLPMPFQGAGR